ncbi:MAG TPA: class I SAM-dependent methyltransferase [Chitinophagales bacterium]|nr:class I SAM-dependent methyltransferase [Chitinophagales bacterium]
MPAKNKPLHPQFSPFDQVAEHYDIAFSESPVGLLQRERVHQFLSAAVSGKSLNILEMNCGTGQDAIWLAEKGHQVTATDASGRMVEVVIGKIKNRSLELQIEALQISFKGIKRQFPPSSYDLIFSDFGGLNCIPKDELQLLLDDAASLLKPHGKFIAVIMGRKCLWERSYFLLKGKPGDAFRRNKVEPVKATIGNEIQQTWYYSPKEVAALSSANFKTNKIRPVGIAIPPSYLNPFFIQRKILLSALNKLERMFSISIFSNYADHFYIELQKDK